MKGAIVIAGKDLRNMFMSPLFYVLAGICSALWALSFFINVGEFLKQTGLHMYQTQMSGQQDQGLPLHYFVVLGLFKVVNLVMIFASAAISMRLFTEEKRQRTYDLLLTSPVTATEIAVGKLFAGIATAWALLAIATVMPASLGLYGKLDWGALSSCVIGIALLTSVYVAIGMFASIITSSALIAVILALIFNVMLWFLGAFSESAGTPVERAIFDHISVGTHLNTFMVGTVTVSGLVFFASLVFLFTFLTQRVVESSRWR